jgi:hypothetical protein
VNQEVEDLSQEVVLSFEYDVVVAAVAAAVR